jgi:hypothetical protein
MTNAMNLGTEYKIKHTSSKGDGEIIITIDQVDKLYIGKGNNCRCGCRGEYFDADEHEGKIIKALRDMASGKEIMSEPRLFISNKFLL